MRTVRLDIAYDGTDFRGFAPQPGARTVGGQLETVLQRVLGEPVRVTPAGRTDAGVHALAQVVSFTCSSSISGAELKRALNALVDDDLYVRAVSDAPDGFDARRSARSRAYRYTIWNAPEPNLWKRRWVEHVPASLDVEAMDAACQALVGTHDFAAFHTHKTQDDWPRSTVRTVRAASWRRGADDGPDVQFTIEADAFLRHMVRTIVGTSILIGLGKAPPQELAESMKQKERAGAGPTAPARGLTLLGVTYSGDSAGG
ncbi:MAG TPA: tRNA pseudouridine(38-40) synthase TruA [Chloroflexota bacterium]|nr:tRNA pseudouridine(38-40) synthase TruA [Chloroflexota bacterium]